jgi:arsenate reductase-like glutaredoxin family protein
VQSTGKDPIEGDAALAVLDGVRHLHVAKGKKIESFDLKKERPSDEELLAMLLGRSGKLRAPALRTGDTLVVGFNQDVLSATLL